MSFILILLVLVIVGAFAGMSFKSRGVLDNLKELVENQLLETEQAEKIKAYYQNKKANSNIAIIILSVIGVILIGLGIILVVSYNWYQIPKFVKLGIGLTVLVAAQCVFFLNIYKKKTSLLAVEGSSVFLTLMIAAVIALIGQVYNLPGTFEEFLFMWLLLILPIPYIYGSSITSIIYLIGTSIWMYAPGVRLFEFSDKSNIIMYLIMVPFALKFISNNKYILREKFIEITLFLTIAINLIMFSYSQNNILNPLVMINSILVVILFISSVVKKLNLNLTQMLVKITIIIELIILAFDKYYHYIDISKVNIYKDVFTNFISVFIFLIALGVFYYCMKKKDYENLLYVIVPVAFTFTGYIFDGKYSADLTYYFINIYLMFIAINFILRSTHINSLRMLNAGLLITIILVFKWFLSGEFGILQRAAGLIISGVILIVLNMTMIKRKKEVKGDE
ncbi:MAG TPA: hypothetical protein DEP72_05715 [Clostridiales bacterium]|nr:MAG: hypothetical protein A2Y18_02805 [Clostridiales bacterium GWD2_32_19]HCC07640.1 hypothetical protein [Clostridiales bacterium]